MIRVRHIATETKTVDGKDVIVPKLDEHGNEIEIYNIAIPPSVHAEGGEAIDAYVAATLAAQSGGST